MRAEDTTVEDLEKFWESLQGPLGRALRDAGSIMNQRLEPRGQTLSDLSDIEMLELFAQAFREAAPRHYQHMPRETVDARLEAMLALVRMDVAANAETSDTVN
jgi:hypothetical protein